MMIVRELHTLRREPVDVRRLVIFAPVGRHVRVAEIVGHDKHDIRPRGRRRNRRAGEERGAGAEGRWENGFISRINYTYQDVRNTNSARFVTNSPRHIAKASLTAPLPLSKSFATLEGVYNSARLNSLGERIAGGVIFNLTLLSRDIIENLDLSASVYNLFDSRYSHPAGSEQYNSRGEALREIAQDGISFRVKATWRF